jgi:hypothetical protein
VYGRRLAPTTRAKKTKHGARRSAASQKICASGNGLLLNKSCALHVVGTRTITFITMDSSLTLEADEGMTMFKPIQVSHLWCRCIASMSKPYRLGAANCSRIEIVFGLAMRKSAVIGPCILDIGCTYMFGWNSPHRIFQPPNFCRCSSGRDLPTRFIHFSALP